VSVTNQKDFFFLAAPVSRGRCSDIGKPRRDRGALVSLHMFRRVLVANRGEIAARITRGVQASGAEAVVAAADDDASSIATLTADRVAKLGLKGPQAFLDAERLVRAAVDNGCDALHPGIGFLSESPVVSDRPIDVFIHVDIRI